MSPSLCDLNTRPAAWTFRLGHVCRYRVRHGRVGGGFGVAGKPWTVRASLSTQVDREAARSAATRSTTLPSQACARTILHDVLRDAPLHDAAMGFRRGRGVFDHAACHVERRWVVSMDLRDFFPSITVTRVAGVFSALGLERQQARMLAELTTHATKLDRGATRQERQLYCRRHLPQGAPTSPALANLAATHLDRRLAALAASIGGAYSRYADDLVLSFNHRLPWLVSTVGAIAYKRALL